MFNRLSNLSNRMVLAILISIAVFSSGLSLMVNLINGVDTTPAWWVSWLQNFSTEMFGAFLTFVLIELIVGGREKRLAEERTKEQEQEKHNLAVEQEKSRLIRQMRSKDNPSAIRAVEELSAHGWLYDGSMKHARLSDANLREANLKKANLTDVWLDGAELHDADLRQAIMEGAILFYANLQNAKLLGAKLFEANLTNTNLRGANLYDADLGNAKLTDAQFDSTTILPDGNYWTSAPETDLTLFTGPLRPHL